MARAGESTPLRAAGRSPPPVARAKLIARVVALAGIAVVLIIGLVLVTQEPAKRHKNVRSSQPSSGDLSSPPFPGASDQIAALPGKPDAYTSRLFSGYLPIHNGGEGFYFFAESQSDTPEQDPVLLWINGGPGASSLGGCFTENGPLFVNGDGETLRVNEYAWNQNANMLCIESPVGVGFTYNASGVYKSDDVAQADDLYWMLQTFFDKFPWLRANDFVISGESYGGVYVPMTAKRIVEGNAVVTGPVDGDNATASARINLKKFVVGNGVNEYLSLSKIGFAYYHGLISSDTYKAVGSVCPTLLTPGAKLPDDVSDACVSAIMDANVLIQSTDINSYNIYTKCSGGDPMAGILDVIDVLNGPPQATPRPIALTASLCLDFSGLSSYMNVPAVRTAMHTKPEVAKWSDVSLTSANLDLPALLNKSDDEIAAIIKNKVLDYTSTQKSITDLWKQLLNDGVQGLIYHGDIDISCDFIGGLWAVESLQLPRKQPRSTWAVPGDDQTAGFLEDFGALKYVTVKGAGHMVPSDKPREAKAMLDQFVLPDL